MRKATFVPMLIVPVLMIGSPATASEGWPERVPQQIVTAEFGEIGLPNTELPMEILPPPPSARELLLEAALAQVGVYQDCTDLVQNALASLGRVARRDSGGPDLGVPTFLNYGVQINPSEALPGDIALTGSGDSWHVWIIVDPATNLGVHGGFNGMNTVVANNGVPISAHTIVRVVS